MTATNQTLRLCNKQSDITMKNKPDIFNILRVIALFSVLGIHSKIVISEVNPAVNFPWYIYTPAWGAMWMFFTLSGYLLGKGFYNGKYRTETLEGVKQFYISRFIRIALPYYLFLFLIFCFVNPVWFCTIDFKYVLKLLTFTYNGDGNPGIPGVGATWFVSTIFQFYLLAPFVYEFLLKRLDKRMSFLFFWGLVVCGALIRYCGNKLGFPFGDIYTLAVTNLDCFFGGMIFNAFTKQSDETKIKKILQPLSVLVILSFIGVNAWFYAHNMHMQMYMYRYPTVYILLFCLCFYAFDTKNRTISSDLTFSAVVHNPFRIFDCIAKISFGMYLYHSNLFSVVPKILNASKKTNSSYYLIISVSLGVVICIIAATVQYFAIEKPCNKFRKREEK